MKPRRVEPAGWPCLSASLTVLHQSCFTLRRKAADVGRYGPSSVLHHPYATVVRVLSSCSLSRRSSCCRRRGMSSVRPGSEQYLQWPGLAAGQPTRRVCVRHAPVSGSAALVDQRGATGVPSVQTPLSSPARTPEHTHSGDWSAVYSCRHHQLSGPAVPNRHQGRTGHRGAGPSTRVSSLQPNTAFCDLGRQS